MRKIDLKEVKGIWRSEDLLLRYDLTIRIDAFSVFSKIRKEKSVTIQHIEGSAKIVYNEDVESQSIWIGENFELKIDYLGLDDDEIILELPNGKFRFRKII